MDKRQAVEVHVHYDNSEIRHRLDLIEALLEHLKLQGEINMALNAESLRVLADIDADTTAIGLRLDALIANPNTTEAEFRAALAPIASRLKVIAHDPNQPVPPMPLP